MSKLSMTPTEYCKLQFQYSVGVIDNLLISNIQDASIGYMDVTDE